MAANSITCGTTYCRADNCTRCCMLKEKSSRYSAGCSTNRCSFLSMVETFATLKKLWKYFKKKIIKNKYYETFSEFEISVEQFFMNFDQYLCDLKTLLSFKFGIIKAS